MLSYAFVIKDPAESGSFLGVSFSVKTDFIEDKDDVPERVPAWIPEVGDRGLNLFCFAARLVGYLFGDDLTPEFFLRVMVPREVQREESDKV